MAQRHSGGTLMKPPLPLSERAQAEWNRVAGEVRVTDTLLLAAYCEQVAQWEQWVREFREAKTLKERNTCATRIKDCVTQLTMLAREFGFTPHARRKIGEKEKPSEAEELQSFLGGK